MALTFGGKRKPGGMGPRTPLDPLEQQLTDRIAAVLRALRNSTDVDAYVRAIQALDPDALERLLVRVEMGALGARIEETLRNVVVTGGSAEGQRIIRETPRVPSPFEALQYPGSVLPSGIIVPPGLAPPPDVEFQVATQRPDLFEYVDRRATEYARTRAANLVVQVDSANRLAIRRVIHESFTQPATADQTARKLRSMVGLHTRWARAVMNFDDANYRRFLKDGMTQEAARARADVLTKRYSDRLIRRRAEMIARTEIQQAQNWGRQAAWDGGSKAGYVDMGSMKEWRTAPMGSQYGPPCPICTELRGTRVPYNGTFANGYEMPPAHPHCFVAGTIVGGPEVTGSTARWFEGEVVELRLSEGPALTGTPNHPILTTRGWVALGEIREGDEVIRNAALQRAAAGVSPDDDEHPARIENVADTVGSAGGVLSREVPVSGPDFHGDGAGSEVAVVRAYRLLRDDVTAEVEEPACDHGLAPAAEGALRLDGGGDPLAMVNSLSATPDGIVGGSDVGAVLLGTPLRDHEAVRFSAPSGLRSSDPQDTDDDAPAHPESLRERFHRLAPEVSLGDLFRCGVDVVTSVVRSVFAGHVYNLETVDGWYSANGIVVHNCRCTAVLIPPSRGLTGQPSQDMDSWLEQLDALDAESIAEYDAVRKHGDPSRPGYAALHPSSRTGSATAPSLGHDGTPLPSGWSLLSAEDRVAERMRQRDAGYGDQSSREARDRRDGDLWEIRRQERALTVYEGAGGARVYLDRIPLADGEDHHVVSQSALRPILQQVDRLQSTDPIGDVDITVTAAAFRGRPPDVMGWALLGADRHTLTAERHSIRPSTQRIALNPTGVSKGGPVQQGHHGNLMPTSITHPDHYYLTHEWGHAIDVRASDQARNDHREIGDTPHLLDSLSSYGRSNEYESYAESFAEWTLSGGATSRAVARHFAEKYGWGTDAAVAKAAAGGPGRICVDTFTLDPGPSIEHGEVVVKSLTKPTLGILDPGETPPAD